MADVHVVPEQGGGDVLVHLGHKLQLLLLGPHPQDGDGVVEGGEDVVALLGDLHFARLDLGQVQDAVDVFQQNPAAAPDVPEAVVLLLGVLLPQAQLGHAQNGVEGGADIVAHVGQKLALGLAGGLGGLGGDPGLLLLLPQGHGGGFVLENPQGLGGLLRVPRHGQHPHADPGAVLLPVGHLRLALVRQDLPHVVILHQGLEGGHIVRVHQLLAVPPEGAAEPVVLPLQQVGKVPGHLDAPGLILVQVHHVDTLVVVGDDVDEVQLVLGLHQLLGLEEEDVLLFLQPPLLLQLLLLGLGDLADEQVAFDPVGTAVPEQVELGGVPFISRGLVRPHPVFQGKLGGAGEEGPQQGAALHHPQVLLPVLGVDGGSHSLVDKGIIGGQVPFLVW